jgi:isopenicillin-N epimerase
MWSLSADVLHLNHGAFGAVPVEIQEKQEDWRRRWESNPTRFVHTELNPGLEAARDALADFVGADRSRVAFVRNASHGVSAVARSVEGWISAGDEIITTSQDYNAVRQTLEYAARSRGGAVRVVPVPFPIDAPETVTRMVLGSVGERTRLVVIDHITSSTGVIYPVEEIVSALEPDVPVLVDGAHGPGQVPLDLDRLGASWYTGNLHKWVCAPKGAAFLHSRADRVEMTVPTVISHAWNMPPLDGSSRYLGLFDWTGTDDTSPWLVIPDVLRVVGDLEPGGWPALMTRNHEMVLAARDLVCGMLRIDQPAPEEMIGSMAGVPLPDLPGEDPGGLLSPLNAELLMEGFETSVTLWPGWPHQVLRLSAHHYNTIGEYQLLARRLSELVG